MRPLVKVTIFRTAPKSAYTLMPTPLKPLYMKYLEGGGRWVAARQRIRLYAKTTKNGSATAWLRNSKKSFSPLENTVFCARKQCFPCCEQILRHYEWASGCKPLLPPATHLPPPPKCLTHSGLSDVGGRVAAKRIKKFLFLPLSDIYGRKLGK